MQDFRPRQVISALLSFFDTSPTEGRTGRSPDAEVAAVDLSRAVAVTVPAYGEFLRERGIEPSSIATPADFRSLPLTTKENYLRRYPLADRCRHGRLETCDFIAVSSGTTGEPTFWPRFASDELPVARRFESVFRDNFRADEKRTLAVVCFPMGTWVGGTFTACCCRHLAAKGYPLVTVTPGANVTEILRVVEGLGDSFERVVLLGYPPFLKETIDTGIARGMKWSRYRIGLVLAGEVFSEEWREMVGERVGATDIYHDSASLYGTADAGVLGNETPLSVCIRRFLARDPAISRALFGQSRLPTLVQYDPGERFFEAIDGTLVFTGDNGVPLIRYHIADEGGVIPYGEMLDFLGGHGFDPRAALPSGCGVHPLPFVYVFGRSRFVLSYFGANIYPENVASGLEQPGIRELVTGKFVMEIGEDADRDRFLWISVELAAGVEASEGKREAIATSIRARLRYLNSEFANYVPPDRQHPRIELLPLGDPDRFPSGVKHRYSR